MTPDLLRLAANGVALLHFVFIPFAVLGGLLVPRWPPLAWLHVPACLWAAGILLFDWICPLTTWEQTLRRRAGDETYDGGFISHYITGAEAGAFGGTLGYVLAAAMLAFNALLYARWLRRRVATRA